MSVKLHININKIPDRRNLKKSKIVSFGTWKCVQAAAMGWWRLNDEDTKEKRLHHLKFTKVVVIIAQSEDELTKELCEKAKKETYPLGWAVYVK